MSDIRDPAIDEMRDELRERFANGKGAGPGDVDPLFDEIDRLRTELAERDEQEPFAWHRGGKAHEMIFADDWSDANNPPGPEKDWEPVYKRPPAPAAVPENSKIGRLDAIKIIDRATDRDDPFWEWVVEEFYNEEADDWPTIYDVFAALGITEDEYKRATGVENTNWPAMLQSAEPASRSESERKAEALNVAFCEDQMQHIITMATGESYGPDDVDPIEVLDGWIQDDLGGLKYGRMCRLSEYPEEGAILLMELEPPESGPPTQRGGD